MLMREIIKPKKASFTIHFPEEMIGKTVEVIAFEIKEEIKTPDKEKRLQEIEELTKSSLVDLGKFKFDRDQANDYD